MVGNDDEHVGQLTIKLQKKKYPLGGKSEALFLLLILSS